MLSISGIKRVIDYASEATKQGLSRDQIMANGLIMLDQEFEQSVIRGIADKKSGRLYRVPESVDPIEFLHALAQSRLKN